MLTITFGACHGQHADNKTDSIANENSIAERISRTASITLDESIEKVFPLFGAFEERKWSEGWNPHLIYPTTEKIEEGTTFKTPPHLKDEKEYLWIVSKYDATNFLIQYLVTSSARYWTITIQCHKIADSITTADITYTFTGLTDSGNEIDKHMMGSMYKNNLKDWEEAIAYYLKTGNALKHH